MKPRGALGDTATRVLGALIDQHRRHGRCTIRSIAAATGRDVGWVHTQLRRLRDEGLATWEPGKEGTLRPTCTIEHLCDQSATLGPDNLSGPGAVGAAPGRGRHHLGGVDMAGHYPGDAAPDQGAA